MLIPRKRLHSISPPRLYITPGIDRAITSELGEIPWYPVHNGHVMVYPHN
jgi:hypothetical protein